MNSYKCISLAIGITTILWNGAWAQAKQYSWDNLPTVQQPVFKKDTVSIVQFGARPNGITLNTEAINKAIAYSSEHGGGVVLVPQGVWLTGPVELKSNVNLHITRAALLQFTADKSQYQLVESNFEGKKAIRNQSPVYGYNLVNVAITGDGVMDGNGDVWRVMKKDKATESEWKELIASGGVVSADGKTWYPSESYRLGELTKNTVTGGAANEYTAIKDYLRPNMLALVNCNKVLLQNATFQNSPAWCLHLLYCEQVTVEGVRVRNLPAAQNGDGIDLESCSYVQVNNSTFDCGDDGICIKSGKDEEGRRVGKASQFIVISNNVVYRAHGGFVIGSEMSGGVHDIFVSDCTFIGTDVGLRFKTARGRGGIVENIYIRNIGMHKIVHDAISFDMYYFSKPPAGGVATIPEVTAATPQFRRFYINNLVCEGAERAMLIRGLPEMHIRDIYLDSVIIQAKNKQEISDASNISMKRVTVLLNDTTLPSKTTKREYLSRPLVTHIYTADPSAHLFNKRIYIYPSHDTATNAPKDLEASHYNMMDYHVLSMEAPGGKVTDHGVALSIGAIPWASKQLWAPDAAFAKNRYYLYFPAKNKQGVFQIGVATSNKPEGPFVAEKEPIKGSYSIDPCVFKDDNGDYYMYFGGIKGGQLQRWNDNQYDSAARDRQPDELALLPRVVKMAPDMKSFAEPVKTIQLIDSSGHLFTEKQQDKRFFEGAWLFKKDKKYYFTYSTGTTHYLCYATGDTPYGPFVYGGILLLPVAGWTTHHSILQQNGKWFLFYHDTQLSGENHLRNIKVTEMEFTPEGAIQTINPFK